MASTSLTGDPRFSGSPFICIEGGAQTAFFNVNGLIGVEFTPAGEGGTPAAKMRAWTDYGSYFELVGKEADEVIEVIKASTQIVATGTYGYEAPPKPA